MFFFWISFKFSSQILLHCETNDCCYLHTFVVALKSSYFEFKKHLPNTLYNFGLFGWYTIIVCSVTCGDGYHTRTRLHKATNQTGLLRAEVQTSRCITNLQLDCGDAPQYGRYWQQQFPNTTDHYLGLDTKKLETANNQQSRKICTP